MAPPTVLLQRLAALYGIQTAYDDVDHKSRAATAEFLFAGLRVLGAPVNSLKDVPSALQQREAEIRNRTLEPVTVVWGGHLKDVTVQLHGADRSATISGVLTLEDGARSEFRWMAADVPSASPRIIAGEVTVAKVLSFGIEIPPGYHRLILDVSGAQSETLIIAAPETAYMPDDYKHQWGAFLPLYALRSAGDWGVGDYPAMGRLATWVGKKGGRAIATLPLLDQFLDNPFEPSPYLPISKLFWDELYIDVTAAPEFTASGASELAALPEFRAQLEMQHKADLVDYRAVMDVKRRALAEMSRSLLSAGSVRRTAFEAYLRDNPAVEEYGRFRAAVERQHSSWQDWQAAARAGELTLRDYDMDAARRHMYAQWLADTQMADAMRAARDSGVRLYLDLPLGTHPQGFDTWRYNDVFVPDAAAGAPPDLIFTRGQDWAFPPLHPDRIRESGYEYVIACLRHHLKHSGMLRIDHVMGFHRLFVIPRGLESSQGIYIRYRPEELYAILCLESQRNQCIVVGEDLGIVPDEVRAAMEKHHLQRLYIAYYELAEDAPLLLPTPRPDAVGSLTTHDMPPFAAFWSGADIEERLQTGIIKEDSAVKERARRRTVKDRLAVFLRERKLLGDDISAASVLRACLAFLASGPANLALVNIEDLWVEEHTQNIPSTSHERPNWRFKAKYDHETFCNMESVVSILEEVDKLRKSRVAPQADEKVGTEHADAATGIQPAH